MTFQEACEEVAGQAGANRTDSDAVKAWTEAGFEAVENWLAVRLEWPIEDETISNCIILGAVTASMRQASASDWRIYYRQFEEAVRLSKARMEREAARFPVGPTDPLVNLAWSSVLEREAEETLFFRKEGPERKKPREASRVTAQYTYGAITMIDNEDRKEFLTRIDEVSSAPEPKAAPAPTEPRPHRQPRPVEEEVLDEQPVRMRRRPEREDHE